MTMWAKPVLGACLTSRGPERIFRFDRSRLMRTGPHNFTNNSWWWKSGPGVRVGDAVV